MCISGHLQESDEKKNNSKKIPTKNNKNLYNQSALNLTDIMKRLLSTIGIFLGVLILISKYFWLKLKLKFTFGLKKYGQFSRNKEIE